MWNSAGKRDEWELSGGIPTVGVLDKRWEVNHCSESVKQRKCQTRWKDDGVGWSGREYQRQLIDQEETKAGDLLHGDGIRKVVM